jgi:hypothetical protein
MSPENQHVRCTERAHAPVEKARPAEVRGLDIVRQQWNDRWQVHGK